MKKTSVVASPAAAHTAAMQSISHSEHDTTRLAADLAASVGNNDVICLSGTLGMGKSVFARALIRTLCGDDNLEVPSPTFTLVQIYERTNAPLWHFDLYRLKAADEIFELGWEEAVGQALMLIEWPERLGPYLPRRRIDIRIVAMGDSSRTITIERIDG